MSDDKLRKRSLVIAGHRTSISLEDDFWDALREMAGDRGLSLPALVVEVDSARGGANLSSALRVAILRHYREKLISPAQPI
ncbi:Predicted DNA-binding protein, contains Ribbon-helix-helix (RHH) domain [Rhodoblastus acidophilus]|uniref:Predicted DNA-binding protein, contains Ribbon-helix-helix (RHH) domain n=1 Tax=Rhodoblastus acidophilus TaxID=1074 RepID=A0A212RU34_RHOAC|nr:ribbon-helix-helix domain-containing protein [Rhodoblastus acidophilus]MCW2315398.1 putative DNA-binding ribbon-helix-helix protein [Rhodoblastus acidophilus]PPQ37378.1 aryl-sulfate sulfotransferase [Rhodoblastus acidophilus]RAI23164.1 aryl-sulfate sulfotransferase [Rhodoblastus acidophilus]SNB76042.1 Predicted DNA-binding protein, contains Ribbon-helix-helix (RHH) domain [Rhodoblastus acidophilus]